MGSTTHYSTFNCIMYRTCAGGKFIDMRSSASWMRAGVAPRAPRCSSYAMSACEWALPRALPATDAVCWSWMRAGAARCYYYAMSDCERTPPRALLLPDMCFMDASGLPAGWASRPPDPLQRKLAAYLQHWLMLPLCQNLDHKLPLVSAHKHVHQAAGR